MFYFLLIIVIIILLIKISNLKDKIAELQNEVNKQKGELDGLNFCPKCGTSLKEIDNKSYKAQQSIPSAVQVPNVTVEKPVIKPKTEMSEKEIKNSTILTVGAILVIISAIVFLTSTWNTSLDIVKTLIIFFMFLVFLGSSVIADKYLHIKETAKVFLYIALSYLPLVFFSISLFHLLGDYLSINGEGKYIYLFISSAILSFIYYYISRRKNDVFTAVGSIIFQVLSIALLSLIFTDNISLIFVLLAIYNFLYHYLYNKNTYYYNQKVHNLVRNTLTGAIAISSVFFLVEYNLINDIDWLLILYLVIMYFNHYYALQASKESKEIFNYTGPVHILTTSLLTAYVFNGDFTTYQILLIAGILITYFIDYIDNKEISFSSFIISSMFYLGMYLLSFFIDGIIPSYLIILLYAFFFVLNAQYIKGYKSQLNKALSIPFFIFIINTVYTLEFNVTIIPIVCCLIFIISNILEKETEKVVYFQKTSAFFSVLGFLLSLGEDTILLVLLSAMFAIIYYLLAIMKKKNDYQLVSYAFVIAFFFYLSIRLEETISLYSYIIPISCLTVYILDSINPNISSKSFLKILFIVGFINLLVPSNNTLTIISYLVLTLVYILFLKETKENLNFLYVPFASYSVFFINNTYPVVEQDILLFISLGLIGLFLYLIYITKNDRYAIMSAILALITIVSRTMNKYYAVFLLLLCFAIYYLYCNKKYQDLYKAGIYILITILLRFVIGDLGLEFYTVLRVGVYVISYILISRTIIKKYTTEYKTLEYIALSILFLLAISLYEVEFNGMLFILLLLALTIIGYYKKWGPIFLTSLIFILINVFIQTRLFWLSLPWWVYLLLVGCILIAFAVNNELRDKNNYKNKIKDMADKIDL